MAIYDLMTAQCDRHSENIFIDRQGKLMVCGWQLWGTVATCCRG